MRRYGLLIAVALLLASFAGCAPAGTSDGSGDGLHSIVPSVTGLTLTEAAATLDEAGYVIGTISGDTSSADAVVMEQEPIASTSLPRDAGVDLVLGVP